MPSGKLAADRTRRLVVPGELAIRAVEYFDEEVERDDDREEEEVPLDRTIDDIAVRDAQETQSAVIRLADIPIGAQMDVTYFEIFLGK